MASCLCKSRAAAERRPSPPSIPTTLQALTALTELESLVLENVVLAQRLASLAPLNDIRTLRHLDITGFKNADPPRSGPPVPGGNGGANFLAHALPQPHVMEEITDEDDVILEDEDEAAFGPAQELIQAAAGPALLHPAVQALQITVQHLGFQGPTARPTLASLLRPFIRRGGRLVTGRYGGEEPPEFSRV